MAEISVNQKKGNFGNNPYGNTTALIFTLMADTKGFIVGSSHNAIPKANDIIHLGELPAGFIPFEYHAIVDKEFNAGAFDVGFSYVDGADSTEYPKKETGLFTLPTLTTKDDKAQGYVLPKAFPKTASLDLKVTTPTAAGDKAGSLTIIVVGTLLGHA